MIILIFYSSIGAEYYSPQEVTYFEFNSHMFDKLTGYLELKISFTYIPEEDIVSMYYRSEYGLVALLLDRQSRDKFLTYIEKYEAWNKKALENNYFFWRKKYIGNLGMGIYFKYGGRWHNGRGIMGRVYFLSIHRWNHQLVINPTRVLSQQNKYLIYKPDVLYFTAEDLQMIKKALQDDFIKKAMKFQSF